MSSSVSLSSFLSLSLFLSFNLFAVFLLFFTSGDNSLAKIRIAGLTVELVPNYTSVLHEITLCRVLFKLLLGQFTLKEEQLDQIEAQVREVEEEA